MNNVLDWERAHAAGYKAIALTVNLPVAGKRESELGTPFRFPAGMGMADFSGIPGYDAFDALSLLVQVNGLIDPSA